MTDAPAYGVGVEVRPEDSARTYGDTRQHEALRKCRIDQLTICFVNPDDAGDRSLAEDPILSGCQVTRFLVLHKQLDADDGELTRTLKVRRNIIAERYAALIDALYGGAGNVLAEVEVTYEDGRKGKISGDLEIRDLKTFPRREQTSKAA